jgi:hypothetical protein
VFPPQPNDPHRLVTQPLSLKCYPQYSRSDDIPLVYSSSVTEAATVPIKNESLYTAFTVYFMDYRPPNIFSMSVTYTVSPEGSTSGTLIVENYFYSKNFFLNEGERNLYNLIKSHNQPKVS